MIRHEILSGWGDQRGQLFDKSKRFKNNGSDSIPERLAQPVVYPPVRQPAEPDRGEKDFSAIGFLI